MCVRVTSLGPAGHAAGRCPPFPPSSPHSGSAVATVGLVIFGAPAGDHPDGDSVLVPGDALPAVLVRGGNRPSQVFLVCVSVVSAGPTTQRSSPSVVSPGSCRTRDEVRPS
jgi:hypothetical protein